MIELIFAKMAAGWVKALVIVAALLMPMCLLGWVWEGVALHGISLPLPSGFPLYGPWEFVHGALADTRIAIAARDTAIRDRDQWKKNAGTLQGGLDRCNAGVDGLAAAGKKLEDAAQALVDQRLREQRDYQRRIDAVGGIKDTGAKCPSVDNIYRRGFGP